MNNATGQTTPLPSAASTQYFSLDDDGDVLAARPLALDEQRPQVRVLRRTGGADWRRRSSGSLRRRWWTSW